MADPFENTREGIESPVDNALDIDAVKSDTIDLATVIRGIHVNVAGNVRGILNGDSTAFTYTMNAGQLYPYRFKRVFTTSTTATGLIGLF